MPWQPLVKWHVKQRRHEAITLTGGRVRRSRPAVLAEQGSFQRVNPGSLLVIADFCFFLGQKRQKRLQRQVTGALADLDGGNPLHSASVRATRLPPCRRHSPVFSCLFLYFISPSPPCSPCQPSGVSENCLKGKCEEG
ncbi:hypothetical protein HL42_5907 [Trichophyton rubrum]|nr:hypothetical protein HL42_5907 [Trichophyton rubrum]